MVASCGLQHPSSNAFGKHQARFICHHCFLLLLPASPPAAANPLPQRGCVRAPHMRSSRLRQAPVGGAFPCQHVAYFRWGSAPAESRPFADGTACHSPWPVAACMEHTDAHDVPQLRIPCALPLTCPSARLLVFYDAAIP
ncbi:hypothetical protein ACQJBY_059129 [Aegilops geniculata]